MASSVARMPADEWRDHGRLAAGVFGAPFSAKNLRKVLVRERPSDQDGGSTTADPPEPPSSLASAARRRQTQILDRWAARQAREMVTTIERQAHETELSALSTTSQPVSARAASFLRESSPALSDSSACSGAAPASSTSAASSIDVPPNVRASSLIQMWRELEADGGLAPTPRATSGYSNSVATLATALPISTEEPSRSDDSEPFGDWGSDANARSEPAVSSSLSESERGRVVNIVRMLSTGSTAQSSASSWSDDNSDPLAREHLASDHRNCLASPRGNLLRVRGRREIEDLMVRLEQERRRELEQLMERQAVSGFSHRGRIQSLLRFMSIRRELASQGQPKPASRTFELEQLQKGSTITSLRQRFNHRGKEDASVVPAAESSTISHVQFPGYSRDSDHTCIADHFITQRFEHRGHHNGSVEPAAESSGSSHVQFLDNSRDSGHTSTADQFIRQRVYHIGQLHGSGEPAMESFSNLHVQIPNNSRYPGYTCTTVQFTSDSNQYQEVMSPIDLQCTMPEVNSPQSRSEDLHEVGQSTDGSWDERNLWVSNLDWQRPMDSSTSHSWQGEVVTEELEPYTQQDVRNNDGTWMSEPYSWRACGVSRQEMHHELLEKFADNVEIRELLERRTVTTSLASDFRETMNRMIISLLQRQGQHYVDENTVEEDGEQFDWRQNDDFHSGNQVAYASSSLVPLPYQSIHHQESWHDTSFAQNSCHHLPEMEVMQDLRSDMAQIHHEIFELRKLVESCMDWQAKLQQSIELDVSDVYCQSVDSSKRTPVRKGNCCICCELPVDSLLYRCGHMCTCFKCAHELQWNCGRCPICRAQIVDVVRAYPNS